MGNNNLLSTTRYKFRIITICLLVFLNLCGLANTFGIINIAYAAPTIRDANLQVQTVVTGLNSPTSMAFIGPNDMLVLEKNTGMVKRIKDGRILSPPVLDLNVASNSERGLLGIGVLKVTSIHHYVYLYYTKSSSIDGGTATSNQLVRYIFTHNPNMGPAQGTMTSPQILLLLTATPGPNHDGGKVAISARGDVYAVIGDLNRQGKAQNFENGPNADGTGGILRVTRDGNTVEPVILGNTSPLNKYFAYGIRNSFGIDIDPITGRLWDTENGPASNDEINLLGPGYNSGWRDIMGMAPVGFNFNNLETFGGKGKYSNPEFVWTQVVAPTAIEFFNSVRLGSQYQNDMFVGDFNKGRIYNFNLNSQRNGLVLTGGLSDRIANTDSETQSVIFGEGFGGISDLKVGSGDGYLYALSISSGALYRILPKSAAATSFEDVFKRDELEEENGDSANVEPNAEYVIENVLACEKVTDRLEQIEEQEKRGGLNKVQAEELRQRVESIRNNLECQ